MKKKLVCFIVHDHSVRALKCKPIQYHDFIKDFVCVSLCVSVAKQIRKDFCMFHIRLSLLLVSLILIISCGNGEKMSEKANKLPSIKDVPNSAWKKLSQKKIYFGHQSVGYNIIDGIKDIMKEYPQINLNIVETTDLSKCRDRYICSFKNW